MKKYFNLADTTFKGRHNTHKRDFKHLKYRISQIHVIIIKWEILNKVYYGNPKNNMCILCLTKKL